MSIHKSTFYYESGKQSLQDFFETTEHLPILRFLFRDLLDPVLQPAQSATCKRRLSEQPIEIGIGQGEPRCGIHPFKLGNRPKELMIEDRGLTVVRTHLLTYVATEDPSMQIPFRFPFLFPFDRPAGNTPSGVDLPVGQNRLGRTSLHTPPAISAPIRLFRIIGIEPNRRNDLPQQQK